MNKINLFTLFFILCLVSCSKENTSEPTPLTPSIQNPIQGFLSSTGLDQETLQTSGACNEYGFSFIPLVSGKITSVSVKFPVPHSTRVTLWNKQTGLILHTEYINVTAGNTVFTRNITPVTLADNIEYLLSFNSGDYYIHRRIGNNLPNITYPVTVDDIRITSHAYALGTSQTMPNVPILKSFIGDCNFIFEK